VAIGRRCVIGGIVGIAGHLTLGDGVHVTGFSMVSRSLSRPGLYSSGWPAEDARRWRRNVAQLRRLSKQHDDEGEDA